MPGLNEEVIDDRRASIAEAFDQLKVEEEPIAAPSPPPSEAPAPAPSESPAEAPSQAGKEPAAKAPAEEPAKKEITPAPEPEEVKFSVEKPPQSWRAAQKAQWTALPLDVRTEVMRREKEITRTLGETANARSFANQFAAAVQPFQARIQAAGINPLQAVNELLRADWTLSTAPPTQRAQFMAKLIKDYGVDVRELDAALAGKPGADPVSATVEQLVNQRLAPMQQWIAQQEQLRIQGEQQQNGQISQTIEQMAEDPKYPHFEDLREEMADIIDLSAKRGVYLSLDSAYSRAVAMNPEVSKQVATQQATEAAKTAAAQKNAAAQKALGASVSVGGAPGGLPSGAPGADDRRATIAAAFDSIGGR
jgi:hypothetical protein